MTLRLISKYYSSLNCGDIKNERVLDEVPLEEYLNYKLRVCIP